MMAEREGFEPSKGVSPCRFSRPVHSTALPPLRVLVVGLAASDCRRYFKPCRSGGPEEPREGGIDCAPFGCLPVAPLRVASLAIASCASSSRLRRSVRTLEGRQPLPVFKTGAFNRSATSPCSGCWSCCLQLSEVFGVLSIGRYLSGRSSNCRPGNAAGVIRDLARTGWS
jgi:hypothetical protein